MDFTPMFSLLLLEERLSEKHRNLGVVLQYIILTSFKQSTLIESEDETVYKL